MYNYSLNQKGQLYNSLNQYQGSVINGRVYNINGFATRNILIGNVIYDGYHKVVGSVSYTPVLKGLKMHP